MTIERFEVLRGVVHPWYCDSFGHMNVRWYSHFFDDATLHLWPLYWSSHKRMQDELGVHTVTASATVQFQRELVSGDLILVDSSLNRVGGKSSTFILRMLHVDTREVHATYEVTEVFFATKTRKSTSMPTSIRQALESRMDAHFGD
ncbi:thioesterase family protein [Halomonas sp. EGI 63088]|uniref:Thioesterase family protein n=1 Tax=Halomonas flagellata TaxID=2920385 RepID=A0ABS9S089_9GAMM|nr:thioesterase family protein [Halomonas flagellata]MCH4565425.1 thioesterase family protein [Halomonas flagellata]